jgi:TRAP-type C4-dicarboxylate transport system permease small subunit
MDSIKKFSGQLAKVLYHVAGASIVCMMLLTCADILLRFGVTLYKSTGWDFLASVRPIAGTYELVCFMGAVAVSFAMAHTSVEKGHVAVSLLVRMFPPRLQAIIRVITGSFSFILFALISWRSVLYALHLRESGEVSLTLQLPFYPFVFGIAFAAAAVCLVLFVEIASSLQKVSVS